jgi:nickel-dependent lactate racemase
VPDPAAEIDRALRNPIDAPTPADAVRPGDRVALVIADPTRGMPKALMLERMRSALPGLDDARVTVVVGYGKHAVKSDEELGLPPGWIGRVRVVHHVATDAAQHARVGDKAHGFFVNRAVAEADVVFALGAVRPHYFAGFTGGAKAILPGCASTADITANHALRDDPRSWLGVVEGNPARAAQEALVGLLPRVYTLNVVTNDDGSLVAAAYGHLVTAHRRLAPVARAIGTVNARRHNVVIAGASHPTSINIYQITKAVAPAALFLKPGGTLILCGPCPDGVGGADAVNNIIYRHTLTRYLPEGAACYLVSNLPKTDVETTFFRHAARIDEVPISSDDIAVIPNAAYVIPNIS